MSAAWIAAWRLKGLEEILYSTLFNILKLGVVATSHARDRLDGIRADYWSDSVPRGWS